jgi:uncharacterized damage-inducible protein DinB
MPMKDALLAEFEQEMKTTRKVLDHIPAGQFDFKPHPKSWKLSELASHVVNIPYWGALTMESQEFDYAPVGGPPPKTPEAASKEELVEVFEKNAAGMRSALAAASDEDLMKPWTLKAGGQSLFTLPRAAVLRSMVMNHHIHHRAQLSVYLRLAGGTVPAMYGPSADEQQ